MAAPCSPFLVPSDMPLLAAAAPAVESADGALLPLVALALFVALGLGFAAGLLRGQRRLPEFTAAVERLGAGQHPGPWPGTLTAAEQRAVEALHRAADEIAGRVARGTLDLDQAHLAARADERHALGIALAGQLAETSTALRTSLSTLARLLASDAPDAARRAREELARARSILERSEALAEELRGEDP